jgi:ATP-dependent helicase HrpA
VSEPRVDELRQRIGALGFADRVALERRLERARHDRDPDRRLDQLSQLDKRVAAGTERLLHRAARLPAIHYPDELPVSARVDDLKAAILENQVVVIAGETGSGKSTQLPKICLDLGRGVTGLIGHTQPRRIAARALAERIAEETGTELGDVVGYTIRFGDHTGPDTMVKLMTDGILLAEIVRDRMLSRYDTLIIDEAHERSLNIDFLLGYLRNLLPQRRDLKVLITSATIDPHRFSAHFGTLDSPAPVIEVSGRTFPVEVRYRPLGVRTVDGDDDDDGPSTTGEADQAQAICAAVDELPLRGDVLVFLSGEREIRDTAEVLRGHMKNRRSTTEILPLFGRLTAAEQHRVFEPHTGRRVVLATNVAETSLTVPGIRYVIDPGTARISRYSLRTKVQRLPIEPISQASANQRAGRCGRVADGICIRLYSEEDFAARPAFTDPEILRTSLAAVVLKMAALDLGEVGDFPFLDPPDPRQVGDGIVLLTELGAFQEEDGKRKLTKIGRTMSALPVDPQFARMIVAANGTGVVAEVLAITAALAIQDVRERPVENREAAAAVHARFADPRSDFLAILNLWRYLQEQGRELSGNRFRRLCRDEYLHYLRVREWQDLVGQLRGIAKDSGIVVTEPAPDPDAVRIHQAILSGLLAHVGHWDEARREYQGTRGAKFAIWPGSRLAKSTPPLVMAAELVETSRLWARTVAAIEPAWVEGVGAHLLKRQYSEPRWEGRRGSAVATERVTLLGVVIVAARTVTYTNIDPEVSRELFIRHALVEGDWQTRHPFFAHNQRLRAALEEREERARRRDIAVDDEQLFQLYDQRIPAEAISSRHFDSWYKRATPEQRKALEFTEADLTAADARQVDAESYPDRISGGGVDLDVRYVFEPGRADDGVTIKVPLAVLQRVAPDTVTAQIPGLRDELAVALIRALPKTLRRAFVPAPDFAAAALQRLTDAPRKGPLVDKLAAELTAMTGVRVTAKDFDLAKLPDHLRIGFDVVNGSGETIASGKDLAALQTELRGDTTAAIRSAAGDVERTGLTSFPETPIQKALDLTVGGLPVRGYPALTDEGKSVGVRVFPSERDQLRGARAGTRRLLLQNLRSPSGYLRHALPRDVQLRLKISGIGFDELVADATAAAVDALLDWAGGPAFSAAAFERTRTRIAAQLDRAVTDVVLAMDDVLRAAQDARHALSGVEGRITAAVVDARTQLKRLLPAGFATATGAGRLPDLQRYLQALTVRLERLHADVERDRARMAEVLPWEQRFDEVRAALPSERREDPDVKEVAMLLAEWRVSLFAQPMKTAVPVSRQRVERALAAIVQPAR